MREKNEQKAILPNLTKLSLTWPNRSRLKFENGQIKLNRWEWYSQTDWDLYACLIPSNIKQRILKSLKSHWFIQSFHSLWKWKFSKLSSLNEYMLFEASTYHLYGVNCPCNAWFTIYFPVFFEWVIMTETVKIKMNPSILKHLKYFWSLDQPKIRS